MRRPAPMREGRLIRTAAARLARSGVTPNQVSLLSLLFAALAGACLILAPSAPPAPAVLYLLAGSFIALRGLCNLLDGLIAVKGNLKTKAGELFNELPDRLSDLLILVCAGYALPPLAWGPALGWACGSLALLTAYVRTLGVAIGAPACFLGPMAKPTRIVLMIVACVVAAAEAAFGESAYAIPAALISIAVGSAVTTVRRTRWIIREVEST